MTTRQAGGWRLQRFETLEQKQPLAADLLGLGGLGAVTSVVHDVGGAAQEVVGFVDSTANHLVGMSPLNLVHNTLQGALSTVSNLNLIDTVHGLASGLLGTNVATAAGLSASLSGVGSIAGYATVAADANGIAGAGQLNVHIENALANSVLPVNINGNLVGNIQVDGVGEGNLLLSTTTPKVTANSSINVGSLLSGTFNASASPSHAGLGLDLSALTPNVVDNALALI